MSTKMDRAQRYKDAGYKAQGLLDRLYGSYLNYLDTKDIHPFEPYIFDFAAQLDDEPMVRAIGMRLGIYIEVSDIRADELFYQQLMDIIDNLPERFPENYPTLQQMIDINIRPFLEWFADKKIYYDEEDHMDRLRAFIAYYNRNNNKN